MPYKKPSGVQQIRLRKQKRVEHLRGELLGEEWVRHLVEEDADVYKPDGSVLLKYRTNALSPEHCVTAYKALRGAARLQDNRGVAGGKVKRGRISRKDADVVPIGNGVKYRPVKKDGTLSKTEYGNQVKSGVVGYFDRNQRFPYCRETAFNIDNPDRFRQAMPYIREVNGVFAAEMPGRYRAQMERVGHTHPNWVINDTAFTTVTVNSDFRTALHTDKGDLKEGFGVMSAFRRGAFRGCYTLWPAFGVAVSMHTGSVLMADVHEWHCNTPLLGVPGQFERVACVFYYRENMKACNGPEQETRRAKQGKRTYTGD